MAQVAVCSQINTKHINTVWAEWYSCWMLNWWCITWPVGCKSLIMCHNSEACLVCDFHHLRFFTLFTSVVWVPFVSHRYLVVNDVTKLVYFYVIQSIEWRTECMDICEELQAHFVLFCFDSASLHNLVSFISSCIPDGYPYRITSTKYRINTVVPPDDGPRGSETRRG